MALYDVQCVNAACMLKEERLIGSGKPTPTCSACGADTVKLQSHVFGFGFSNSGGNYKNGMAVPKR